MLIKDVEINKCRHVDGLLSCAYNTIPTRRVNFVTGESCTGKTSLFESLVELTYRINEMYSINIIDYENPRILDVKKKHNESFLRQLNKYSDRINVKSYDNWSGFSMSVDGINIDYGYGVPHGLEYFAKILSFLHKYKIVCIDYFEMYMHPSDMHNALKIINDVSKERGVQLFMVTYSEAVLSHALDVFEQDKDDLMVLSMGMDHIQPYTYDLLQDCMAMQLPVI